MWPQWANDYDIAHPLAMAVRMKLIRSESAHWWLSSRICKVSRCALSESGYVYTALMGNRLWCCISTGLDGSIYFDSEWIRPMVDEFYVPWDSRSPYYAQGHFHVGRMGKWPWHCTSTGQDSSNGLDLKGTRLVVAEFCRPHFSKGD